MTLTSNARWRIPALTREAQVKFWDRQAGDYSTADMTTNKGELALVRKFTEHFSKRGLSAEDVVTLGGANGCRDPLVVTEVLQLSDHSWQGGVFFNDLSSNMVAEARRTNLADFGKAGQLQTMSGPIHEIAYAISHRPRRVLLGVYSTDAFVHDHPAFGYESAGLIEYLRNGSRLGNRFVIDVTHITQDGLYADEPEERMFIRNDDSEAYVERHRQALERIAKIAEREPATPLAFRVVGEHEGEEGIFLSHWFTEAGFEALLKPRFVGHTIEISTCAKGFVACIDPPEQPKGIVTMLNNVLGNVLPEEQSPTLEAIRRFSY